MEKFQGFPAGELRFTSVPDLFFARLLPQIDSLIELKITLHFLWVHYRQIKQSIAFNELLTDETLVQSLGLIVGKDVEAALKQGLNRAVTRGTLLMTRIETDSGEHDLYFLNSERGRLAQQKVLSGKVGVVTTVAEEVAPPTKRPNIFELYEDNISLISPIVADQLKDAEATYPASWIEDAFRIAVENNVRKWSYIKAILERMAVAGRESDPEMARKKFKEETGQSWYSEEEEKLIRR